jgi:predicted ribosomally synthesized peptide with nif11-like leader
MSTPAEQLLQKMGEDKIFAEAILKQNEIEKVIELAKEEGIKLTQADIDETNAFIQKAVELQTNSDGELTEEELENVAGGTSSLALAISITAFIFSVTSVSVSVSGLVSMTVSITKNV